MTLSEQEQARADAMADAETLRKVYRTHYKAPRTGDAAYLPDRDMPTVTGWRPASEACAIAQSVAHAAFRAVPGLRGEDTSGRS